MSLSCFECERIGAFNTLIIFARDGNFDPEKPVSHYHNFYTDCATIGQFKKVQTSRFAIVQLERFNYMWNTGSDGELLPGNDVQTRRRSDPGREVTQDFRNASQD